MALLSLIRHPDTSCAVLDGIDVEVARTGERAFVLHYVARGDIAGLKLSPPVRYSSRGDDLWQTTCFEAFVRPHAGDGYAELNFAPSTAWAAYGFSAYREGMRPIALQPPLVDIERGDGRLELFVTLDSDDIALPADSAWQLNITAVIEEIDGRKSYWALAHPPGKPDFHHPDCFVLSLPAAG